MPKASQTQPRRSKPPRPRSATLAIMGSALRSTVRSKLVICALVLSQLLFLLPMLVSYPTLSDQAIGQEQVRQTLDLLTSGISSGIYDSAPDDLKQINEREVEALSAASTATYPSKAFFAAYAEYYGIEIESVAMGYTEPDPSLYARSELIHKFAEVDQPDVYASASEMPTMYYLAFAIGLLPGIALLLPVAAIAFAAQGGLARRSLMQMAPMGLAHKRAACALVTAGLALAAITLTLLPGALIAFVRNGFGDASYPVVNIVDGALWSSTVGEVLARDALLVVGSAAFIVALTFTAESVAPRGGLGLALVLLVAPLTPPYASQSNGWMAIARHLPCTYFSCGGIVGLPVYANGLDICAIRGASWELGCAVLGLSTLALGLLALLINAFRELGATKRLEAKIHGQV